MNKVYSRGLNTHPWGAPVLMSVKFQLVKLGTESIWPDGVKSQTVVHKEELWTTPGVFGLQQRQ